MQCNIKERKTEVLISLHVVHTTYNSLQKQMLHELDQTRRRGEVNTEIVTNYI